MTSTVNSIFNYICKDYITLHHSKEATCEDICIILCKQCGILPATRLLFGLRISGTENWLSPCRPLKPNIKYDFRIRFKVPELSTLKKLDVNTYDYLYHQFRHDLVNDKIQDIKYPAFKDNVLGLGIVDMYIDMIEKNYKIEDLEKNYKKYIPKELVKNHQIFAKRRIQKGLRDIKKRDHDLFYVKGTYLESIKSMAPNYMIEEFNGMADYLPEDDLQSGTCPVTIQFNPFHEDEPGLRVFYKSKNEWKHILRTENIYAIYREGKDVVRFEISDLPNGFRLFFLHPAELKSFITCIAGYFRLMVKWIMDLCLEYPTPSLQELKELKYHGPIGGEYSYAKIREKNNKPGSYIVRQCEKKYETFYIDINTKGTQTETFKITRSTNQWHLHTTEGIKPFDKLTDLAHSIDTGSDKLFRIPPSEYDKPPLLLICLPRNQLTTKKTVSEISEAELQRKRVQIIDPKIDLQWYKNSQKECEGGKMIQMLADWILPGDMRLKVTLKILKSEKHFTEFMKLADIWSRMYSQEFLKLYGLTLSTPHTMVIEYSRFGPLNELLRKHKDHISLLCLLEAVHALVRAIVYLKGNNFIHGYIRCSSLQVVKFQSPKTLVVKLADPGFNRHYKEEDKPWIPFEHHDSLESAKTDPHAELWAFATTVWEIFSRGRSIDKVRVDKLRENYGRFGGILPAPSKDCPKEMFDTILEGWSYDPDKRFSQQLIFSRLASIKEIYASQYCDVNQAAAACTDTSSLQSKNSEISAFTDETLINGSSGSEPSLSCTEYSTMSSNYDKAPLLKHPNSHNYPMYPYNYFNDIPSVVELPEGKVVYKEQIGGGHYGTVYRGEFYNNQGARQVAIKTLKNSSDRRLLSQDFMREIHIMKNLNHRNIVKILTWIDSPQISIIMEYFECGSFDVYLASKKPNLTNDKLLRFALDIASGMDYLRIKNVIHRDLAARNILVDSECVKISDFGLAQIADTNGYYYVQSDREIPIKWYAPEAIKTFKFSFQSDVWSYGVTLFEMFSRGDKPNLDPNVELDQMQLLSRLDRGERLRKPVMCPDNVYNELMLPCWHANPKSRPNFEQIMEKINNIICESGECI